jgi:protein-tyrosine phosphatase
MVDVLLLCTGNICRSPMAEGLLARRLDDAGVKAHVHSAGLLDDGRPASAHGVEQLRAHGVDLTGHRSRRMGAALVAEADLVLGMASEHVREAVVLTPSAWPRTFTLKELVRRGSATGPRRGGEELAEWLARAHVGRSTRALAGARPEDDVADPIGGTPADYARTAAELDDLLERLVTLAWPAGAP